MQLRPLTPDDLIGLADIDAVIDSAEYLHVERTPALGTAAAPGETFAASFRVERRPVREKAVRGNAVDDDLLARVKLVVSGVEDGLAVAAEHDGQLVAMIVAQHLHDRNVVEVTDVRVDFDRRREGLGTAMLYQAINYARDREARALRAEIPSDNLPACALFAKTGFELTGLDTHRHSNHDLVKEKATLLWYLAVG
jgi:ribosomal protein S18 acetylase RimI-like enzyme